MADRTVLRGRVVTPTEVLEDGVVVVDGELIAWVGAASDAPANGFGADVARVPAADDGTTVLPGLVDIHCHGGGGASFPDATTPDQARQAVREHLRHGTTSLVASLVTASRETLRERAAMLADLADAGEIAGIHLEGPFLSVDRCGAQDPNLIIDPDPAFTTEVLEVARGHIATMTVAPEAPGIVDVAARLAEGGALPSWGHTDAGPDETREALAASHGHLAADGTRSKRPTVTHLFNGMRPLHHRDPGPIAECLAAAAQGRAVVELVADGTHLDPALVRSVVDIVGRDNAALVTDAMAAAGMPDGQYRLGSMSVVVADGVARLADGGAIAGGTAHLVDVVRGTVAGGVPLVDAVYMASTVPAAVLGNPAVGALEAGRRADVLVTDADLRPRSVLKAGREVTA